MTTRFICNNCGTLFEAEGRKEEYNSPVYGPCWKMVADCPSCNTLADEYKHPKIKKDTVADAPSCSSSCGCCNRI